MDSKFTTPGPSQRGSIYKFFRAIKSGDTNLVKSLLDSKQVDVNLQLLSVGTTPLHDAVRFNQPAVIQLLVRHGANIFARDSKSLTPFEEAQALSNRESIVAMLWEFARLLRLGNFDPGSIVSHLPQELILVLLHSFIDSALPG